MRAILQHKETAVSFLLNGVLLAAFFLPLLTITSADAFTSNALRVISFFLMVDGAALFWLFGASQRWFKLPQATPLAIAALIFAGVFLLLAGFSVNSHLTFFGTRERMSGILLYPHILLFAWLIALSAQRRIQCSSNTGLKEVEPPIRAFMPYFLASSAASFLVAASAILEYFGVMRFSLAGWVGGVVGNPSILAGYLIPALFISFLILVHPLSRRLLRLVGFLAFTAQLGALVMTDTLSALVAFIAGCVVVAVWLAGERLANLSRRPYLVPAIVASVLLIVAATFFFFARTTIEFEALDSRFIAWKIALLGFIDRPIVGFGEETFGYVFDRYFDPSLVRSAALGLVFDKPHNGYLELLAESGLAGFLAAGLLFVLIVRAIAAARPADRLLAAVLLGALAAYSFFTFFLFDTFYSLLALAPIFAFAFCYARPARRGSPTGRPITTPLFFPAVAAPRILGTIAPRMMASMGILALCGTIWAVGLKGLWGEVKWIDALRTPLFSEKTTSLNQESALRLRNAFHTGSPWTPDYKLGLLDSLSSRILSNGPGADSDTSDMLLNEGLEGFLDSPGKVFPVRTRITLARALTARGIITGDEIFFQLAREQYQAAIQINMLRQDALVSFALLETRMGNMQRAADLLHTALAADNERPLSQWVVAYGFLKQLVYENRESPQNPMFKEALAQLASATKGLNAQQSRNPAEFHFVALAFAEIGDFKQAYRFAQKAFEQEPANERYRRDFERFRAAAD